MSRRLPKKSGCPPVRICGGSASRARPSHHAKTPTGTLMGKIIGHDARSMSHEPAAGPNAAASAPNALRERAFFAREGFERERQSRRPEDRRTDRLDHPRADQHVRPPRQPAQGRGRGEDDHASEESALAPARIRPATCRYEQRGIDDGVGVQHPRKQPVRHLGKGRAECGEGGDNHGRIQRNHEDRDGGDPESPPRRAGNRGGVIAGDALVATVLAGITVRLSPDRGGSPRSARGAGAGEIPP